VLGHVVGAGSCWEALSSNGEPIGIYANWIEAANAITNSAEVVS